MSSVGRVQRSMSSQVFFDSNLSGTALELTEMKVFRKTDHCVRGLAQISHQDESVSKLYQLQHLISILLSSGFI